MICNLEGLDAWLERMNRFFNLVLVFFAGAVFMIVVFVVCFISTGGK